jgi:hypothetical protein
LNNRCPLARGRFAGGLPFLILGKRFADHFGKMRIQKRLTTLHSHALAVGVGKGCSLKADGSHWIT